MNIWRLKRQLVGMVIFTLISFAIVGGIIYFFSTSGTCTDNRVNQGEERVDCGGPCAPCIDVNPRQPLTLWQRYFEVRPRTYDVAALIKNANQLAGGPLAYRIKLFDVNSIVIAERSGTLQLYPTTDTLLFEPNINTGSHSASRLLIEFGDPIWSRTERPTIPANVTRSEFSEDPTPRVKATVENTTVHPIGPFTVAVLLLDEAGTVFAVSRTEVGGLDGSGNANTLFTWPELPQEPRRMNFIISP